MWKAPDLIETYIHKAILVLWLVFAAEAAIATYNIIFKKLGAFREYRICKRSYQKKDQLRKNDPGQTLFCLLF